MRPRAADPPENDEGAFGVQRASFQPRLTFGSGPEQVWIDKAKENFRHGEYGLAERYFGKPSRTGTAMSEAWLGLAASYDHLKRFDEADRAYELLAKDGWHNADRSSTISAIITC